MNETDWTNWARGGMSQRIIKYPISLFAKRIDTAEKLGAFIASSHWPKQREK